MGVRHYRVRLTAVGPVHIGNGNKLGKKDYFAHQGKIAVLDAKKFVGVLNAEQLKAYCDYLQKGSGDGLEDFLKKQGLHKLANKSISYEISTRLEKTRRGTWLYYDVAEFVKDAHGCPYVPGSSFKGVLRTALLAALVEADRQNLGQEYPQGDGWRKSKTAGKALDKKVLWQEQPDKSNPRAVNDIMRFVSVSDSGPLSADDLVFAKKYDKFSKGDAAEHKRRMGNQATGDINEGNDLNIYRECLRPGTEIVLQLDIDERIDGYLGFALDAEGVAETFRRFDKRYEECFASHFDLSGVDGHGGDGDSGASAVDDGRCKYVIPSLGMRCRNTSVNGTGYCNMHQDKSPAQVGGGDFSDGRVATCYLGGGVDFDSKTVMNALFEDDGERINEIARILYAQFPSKIDPERHGKLWSDVEAEGFKPVRMKSQFRGVQLKKAKDDHRHWMDQELGVSPHTLKLGKVNGKLYPMGKCEITLEEINIADRGAR